MNHRSARGMVAFELTIVCVVVGLGAYFAFQGWQRDAWPWVLFGAVGPSYALALAGALLLQRRSAPPHRWGFFVATTLAATLLSVGFAAALHSAALLSVAPVVGFAAGFAVGTGMRRAGPWSERVDQALADLVSEAWPLLFLAYLVVPAVLGVWHRMSAPGAGLTSSAGFWVVVVMAGATASLLGLRWLWQLVSVLGSVFRWTLRTVGFAILVGAPVHFLSLLFFVVLGGPIEYLPALYAAQTLVVVGAFVVWVRQRSARIAAKEKGAEPIIR